MECPKEKFWIHLYLGTDLYPHDYLGRNINVGDVSGWEVQTDWN
jgi:hypothetical protein